LKGIKKMRKKTLGLLVGALVTTSVLAGYHAKGDNMAPAKAAIIETRADKMKDGDMMKDKSDKMMEDDMKKGKSDDMMKDDDKMMKDGMKDGKSDGMMKDDMKKDKSDDMMKDKSDKMMDDDKMMKDKSGKMMDGDMKMDKSNKKMKKKKAGKKMKKNNCKKMKKSDNMMNDNMKKDKSGKMMKDMYDFTLKDLDGNDYKLSDNKGKKVYMKFWASWCSICLTGLEDLDKLAGENNDFEIVTVVAPGRNREMDTAAFKKWFKELGYKNLKVLFDETGEVTEHYGIKVYPTSVYVGSNGTDTTVKAGHNSNDDIKNTIKEIK